MRLSWIVIYYLLLAPPKVYLYSIFYKWWHITWLVVHYLIKNASPTKVCFPSNWICNNVRQKRIRTLLWFQGLFAFCFLQWLCASYLVLYLRWYLFMPDLNRYSSILAGLMPTFHSYVSGIQCLLCNSSWYAGNWLLWFSWLFFNGTCESSGHLPCMWISLINAHYICHICFPSISQAALQKWVLLVRVTLLLPLCNPVECNCTNHCLII